MNNAARDDIRAAIADAELVNGQRAISFEHFMQLALYGQHGFYVSGGFAGRRGDFITSPEVGPLFGAVLARALDAWWRELGEPDDFTVIDAGAGPGTLARSITAAHPACAAALRYVAVEVSAAQRERHPAGIVSASALPDPATSGNLTGVLIANELLDNLAFRLFVMDSGWREAYVVEGRDGTFAEVLRPAPDVSLLALPAGAAHGSRLPVQSQAAQWVRSARALLGSGRLVVIDYASPTTADLARRPWRDWLRTYRGHERGEHYLRHPGSQDITTEVAIDQLVAVLGEPDAVRSQRQFLQRWGIAELVAEGKQVWAAQADRPTLASLAMRSRVSEAEALLADPGLGSFTVAEWEIR